MTDIEKAKQLLFEGNCTCVLCKGDRIYTSDKRGIDPMIDFIDAKTDLKGFSAADKVIGKAAAMMLVFAQVREVYAELMSNKAVEVFEKYNIPYSYAAAADNIINRRGDGFCPMETAVKDIDEPYLALKAIKAKIEFFKARKAGD